MRSTPTATVSPTISTLTAFMKTRWPVSRTRCNIPPGATFWRVAVTHFTPWDCNWPYGPPLDAAPPNAAGVPAVDQQQTEEKTCSEEVGSFVDESSRIPIGRGHV